MEEVEQREIEQGREPAERSKQKRKILDKLWTMSWEECLQAYQDGATLVTIQGYLLAGRDRRMDDEYSRASAKQLYLDSLRIAHKKGRDIPDHVREAHAEDVQWEAAA